MSVDLARTNHPLAGIDEISLPKNAVLKFTYPNVPDLYIHSGATAIQWNYTLNTQSTPTVGGEVVQILSAFVGPLTITGQTAGLKTNATGELDSDEISGWKNWNGKKAYGPNHELQEIIAWFRQYMLLAGTDNKGNVFRSERAIKFTYAERGWSFYIQPTQLSGFRYDKAIISPEWSIQAEIVSDNALDYFSGVTMGSFTDELLTTNQKLQGQIGLSAFAQTRTETNNPNFGQTGDYGSTNPFLNPAFGMSGVDLLKKMGDNFQGLVAAWSTGDFAHFGFGAMLDNHLPNADEAFQKLFGNTLLGSITQGSSGGSGGGSGGGTYTYGGSDASSKHAVDIANEWSSKNMPPELGIATSLIESSLDPTAANAFPDSVGPNGHLGLFQEAVYRGPGPMDQAVINYFEQHKHELPSDGSAGHLSGLPAVFLPSSMISKASVWFKAAGDHLGFGQNTSSESDLLTWANTAQGGGYSASAWHDALAKAKQILGTFGTGGNSGSLGSSNGIFSSKNFAGVDQGVDFSGSGPIPALDNCTITDIGSTTGDVQHLLDYYVIYKLTAGPHKNAYVYVAENLTPNVSVGDKLTQGQTVATAPGTYPYIEIGFNKTATGWDPVGPLGGATAAGQTMWKYIQQLIGLT